MKRPRHPTIANYTRVLSVIRNTSALWERADKRKVGVFTPARRLVNFPHDVVAVTEELYKQGLNVGNISLSKIRNEAIRIIMHVIPQEPVVWKPSVCVITFRIPEETEYALDEMMRAANIVGIRSVHQFVRQLALDFAAHRLVYPDSHDPKVDWYTQQTKAADAV